MTFITTKTIYASGAAHVAHDGKVYGGETIEVPVNVQCNRVDQFDRRGKATASDYMDLKAWGQTARKVRFYAKPDNSRFHVSLRDHRGGRRNSEVE